MKNLISFNTVNGKYCCNTEKSMASVENIIGFNTVNGKYCCNLTNKTLLMGWYGVSIP